MSTYHTGHLVYGIDLGDQNRVLIEQVDEYDSLDLPWVKRDEEGYLDETLTEAFTRRLYEAIPDHDPSVTYDFVQDDHVMKYHGVKILEHGWQTEGDTDSYVLIAHEEEVDGGDARPVNLLLLLQMQKEGGWDEKLAKAVELLGITPQHRPSWLLLASR